MFAIYLVATSILGAGNVAVNGLAKSAATRTDTSILMQILSVILSTAFAALWTAIQTTLYLDLRDWKDGTEVISAAAERIHHAEGGRTNFTVVAGALLAGGVAILTFIPDKRLSNALADFALGASVGSIAFGILVLIVFARQTNR